MGHRALTCIAGLSGGAGIRFSKSVGRCAAKGRKQKPENRKTQRPREKQVLYYRGWLARVDKGRLRIDKGLQAAGKIRILLIALWHVDCCGCGGPKASPCR